MAESFCFFNCLLDGERFSRRCFGDVFLFIHDNYNDNYNNDEKSKHMLTSFYCETVGYIGLVYIVTMVKHRKLCIIHREIIPVKLE